MKRMNQGIVMHVILLDILNIICLVRRAFFDVFNATQTSWIVDDHGVIAVKTQSIVEWYIMLYKDDEGESRNDASSAKMMKTLTTTFGHYNTEITWEVPL